MYLKILLVFFGSTLVSLGIIYFKISLNNITAYIIGIILLLIALLNSYFKKKAISEILKLSVAFTSSLLLEVLVLLSGGFYSPYLFLLYLYTITIGLFFGFWSSIIFLTNAFILLTVHVFINPEISKIIQADPWFFITLILSMTVIVFLTLYLMQSYRLKNLILDSLNHKLSIANQRETSIIKGINEIIIITDKSLKVLSANTTVEHTNVFETSELTGRSLFEILSLVDEQGEKATLESLSIPQILEDKATRTISNLYLFDKQTEKKSQIMLQCQGIVDNNNQIYQFVFIISFEKNILAELLTSTELGNAQIRFRALSDQIKNSIPSNLFPLKSKLDLLVHMEEDMLIAQELPHFNQNIDSKLVDLNDLCNQIVISKQPLALSLKTYLMFNKSSTDNSYITSVKPEPFTIMIGKAIEIGILMTTGTPDPNVKVGISQDTSSNRIKIESFCTALTPGWEHEIISKFYGPGVTKDTNIKLGSGLEGYIFSYLAKSQGIRYSFSQDKDTKIVSLVLDISKSVTL